MHAYVLHETMKNKIDRCEKRCPLEQNTNKVHFDALSCRIV